MRITPLDVHEQTFRMTFRGFDPVEVDAFLQRVADELERLIEERDRYKAELEHEGQARHSLEEALAAARTLQDGMLERARGEAELIVNQAQLKADRSLAEANEALVSLRQEAQELREKRSLWLGEIGSLGRALWEWSEEKKSQPLSDQPLIAEDEEEEQAQEEQETGADLFPEGTEAVESEDETD